jgi:hypothetical protein
MTSFTNVTTNYPQGANTPIRRVKQNHAPTPTEIKNFILGDEWIDTSAGDWWKLANNPTGGLIWVRIGGASSSEIDTVTPDSGTPVAPVLDNIFATGFPVGTANLKGIKTFNGGGAGDILELQNLRDLSRYIVGPNATESQFTSIQTAINTAIADGFNTANPTIVYILPGTYIEDLILQPGIGLSGVGVNAQTMTVLVQGAAVLNPPPGTNAFSAEGITFATNGAAVPAFSIQGANDVSAFFTNCAFFGNSGTSYETVNTLAVVEHFGCFYFAGAGFSVWNLNGNSDIFINCISTFTDTKSNIGVGKYSFFDSVFTDSFICTSANPLFFNTFIISHTFPATNFEAIAIDAASQVGALSCFFDSSSPTGFSVTGTGQIAYNTITTGQPFDPALSIFGFTTFTGNLSFDGGATSVTSDGQLIIGNTGNPPSINTLTAGPGIVISNGPGIITIATTGSGGIDSEFFAYQSANVNNVTGNGTDYQIISDTEVYDTNNDYDNTTGVFTAPITGKYLFCGAADLTNLAGANSTNCALEFSSTFTIFRSIRSNFGAARDSGDNSLITEASFIIPMTAGDTCSLHVTVDGGAQVVGVGGGNPGGNSMVTFFSAKLLQVAGGAGGLSWTDITVGGPTQMFPDNGYTTNSAGLVQLTLPTVAAYGTEVEIVGKGTGGWQINQNGGQVIHFGILDTTVGVGGMLFSNQQYDSVKLLCTVTNTDFTVINSMGNIGVI